MHSLHPKAKNAASEIKMESKRRTTDEGMNQRLGEKKTDRREDDDGGVGGNGKEHPTNRFTKDVEGWR